MPTTMESNVARDTPSHQQLSELSVGDPVPNLPDEQLAHMMTQVMEQNRFGSEMTHVLAERANLVNSVQWLSHHVPVCVLDRLAFEINSKSQDCEDGDSVEIASKSSSQGDDHLSDLSDEDENSDISVDDLTTLNKIAEGDEDSDEDSKEEADISKIKEKRKSFTDEQKSSDRNRMTVDRTPLAQKIEAHFPKLPYASRHDCAMLFVDISGFTKLSKLLTPERLSETINAFFQLIVDEVSLHGGDILKFAGDALFAEWRAQSDDDDDDDGHATHDQIPRAYHQIGRMSLADCTTVAATCGASIVLKCSDYPVFAEVSAGGITLGEQVATLNVHCGLGVGEVVGIHVGDCEARREYLIVGDPIRQSTDAADRATHGQLMASREALAVISVKCELDHRLKSYSGSDPILIACNKSSNFASRHLKQQRRCSVQFLWEGWDTDSLRKYRKLISLYVNPVVNGNDIASTKAPRRSSTIQERHSEEAELRSVYVMFVSMPQVNAKITGNYKEDMKMFKLLNDIMKLSTRELSRFNGHLRQFIVDDKGLVLIATFGLRGSSFPNMVTERALPATTVISIALSSELNVFNRIGATLGNAYCGVVGGVKRHEYAVLGPSVNLAARLMADPKNPGILVDDGIRMKAGKSYGFNALQPVIAKGFDAPVPTFEPLSSLERGWGKIRTLVGRKHELRVLVRMVREIHLFNSPAKMAFVTADSGTGKSTTVIHAIEHIRKTIGRKLQRIIVAKHVCKDSDTLVPFSMLRSILPDVLGESGTPDDKSQVSTSKLSVASGTSFESVDAEWEGLSQASNASSKSKVSGLSGVYASPDRLHHICKEMDAPPEFLELIGHHLLGMDQETLAMLQGENEPKGKAPSPQATVNFMAQAFQLCTKRADLVVIALDDVHQMDEMSWKVLHKLFITSHNLFIMCTSRPLTTTCKLTIDSAFWNDLRNKYKAQGRYQHMLLSPLEKKDIKSLAAIALGVKDDDISPTFENDVYTQSGGMPHFAIEILDNVKRRKCVGKGADGLFGWIRNVTEFAFGSISELILHRVDSFDATVRNVLNLGAVLGNSFELLEIIAVLQHFIGATQSQKFLHAEKIHNSLNILVEEGILRQVYEGAGEEEMEELEMFASQNGAHASLAAYDDHSRQQDAMDRNENISYTFCHDVWRSSIMQLMLDSRKRDMHKIIAMTLEVEHGERRKDYAARVKLFSHWKSGGELAKTASIALSLGKSFEEQGLNTQSIRLYGETLDMLKSADDPGEIIGGLGLKVVESIGVSDLESVVKVHIATGKCLANVHRAAESVDAYQNGLKIYQAAPSGSDVDDRSIVFPIFSGLFVALKFGQIEQDNECTYEQNLVKKFVHETRLNGDPVHYTRALAMQGEMYGRLGNFEKAFEAHWELERVYNVDEHSTGICKAYGSDRSGQSYGCSALWYATQGNMKESLRTCRYIISELMPKMEPRNVHNSAIMIYPTLWILKDLGFALEARENFKKLVVEAFNEHYGAGAFTFCLPVYGPVLMLLDLAGKEGEEVEAFDEYLEWALNEDNLRFGKVINNSLANFGRGSDSISAEICLLVAKRMKDCRDIEKKIILVRHGIAVARESVELTESKGMIASYKQVKPVLDELEKLAGDLGIEVST